MDNLDEVLKALETNQAAWIMTKDDFEAEIMFQISDSDWAEVVRRWKRLSGFAFSEMFDNLRQAYDEVANG